MKNYIVKVKYFLETDKGIKKMMKSYLVSAYSVTEAEAKMTGYMPTNFQDVEITSCSECNIQEIHFNQELIFNYICKFSYEIETKNSVKLGYVTVSISANSVVELIKTVEKLPFQGYELIAISKSVTIFEIDLMENVKLIGSESLV